MIEQSPPNRAAAKSAMVRFMASLLVGDHRKVIESQQPAGQNTQHTQHTPHTDDKKAAA